MSDPIGVGVDIGGTKILLVALDGSGRFLDEVQVTSPNRLEELHRAIAPALDVLVGRLSDTVSPIALGLALPGLVDSTGVLRSAPNLDAQDVGFDLVAELSDPLVAVLAARAASPLASLGNDATAAAFGEVRLGAGRGLDDVFVVSIGTGIGAGIVFGGQLVKGAHGYAGEIGHMVIDPSGPPCPCGRNGCWERFASGSGLAWLATRDGTDGLIAELAGDRPVRGEDVVEAVRRGDGRAASVIDEFATYLAIGLVNAAEILDPQIIVLGGGLITASDVVLGPTQLAFERMARPAQHRRGSDLVPATLGPRAAAMGIALDAVNLQRVAEH